jgi:Cys-tRNA(Pro)/Cys-tRNA(Cys) deacylase
MVEQTIARVGGLRPSYGLPPSAVFKTLVAKLDGRTLLVALVAVDRTLDLKALATAAGGKRAEMAGAAEAERATGYVVGGISPLGQKRALRARAARLGVFSSLLAAQP